MWYAILGVVLLAGDQILKYWVVTHLAVGESAPFLPGFMQLTRLHNYGAAWSSLSGRTVLLVVFTAVLLAAVCLLFVVLSAMLGLFLGLKMPNLTWTSEITPIKQSACVAIALLGGWAYALLLGGGYLLAGWHLGAALYMGCFAGATLAACAVLYLWLKKRGGAVLAAL